jgi:fumarate reductase subunit D
MEENAKKPAIKITKDNIYAILSYLWVLCLVPVLMKKDDKFTRFHAKQGLMLFIIEVALGIIGIVPRLGAFLSSVGLIICAVISVIGIVQVLLGREWKIPFVHDWAESLIKI